MNLENKPLPSSAEKVLEKIKDEKIKPKPRWEFLLKDYLIWGFFGLSIVIGSAATAVAIFVIMHSNWPTLLLVENGWSSLLLDLPYFWLLAMVLFLAVAYYNFKHTKTGYRYSAYVIVVTSIALSLIVGSALYAFGGGEHLESIFYRRVPLYRQIIDRRAMLLVQPEQGHVAGMVAGRAGNQIMIRDFKNKVWKLATTTTDFPEGQRVIIIGHAEGADTFAPVRIEAWFVPRPMMQRPMVPQNVMFIERN